MIQSLQSLHHQKQQQKKSYEKGKQNITRDENLGLRFLSEGAQNLKLATSKSINLHNKDHEEAMALLPPQSINFFGKVNKLTKNGTMPSFVPAKETCKAMESLIFKNVTEA